MEKKPIDNCEKKNIMKPQFNPTEKPIRFLKTFLRLRNYFVAVAKSFFITIKKRKKVIWYGSPCKN